MTLSSILTSLFSFHSHTGQTLKRPHFHSQRGFSMIELVVALGIAGALLTVSQVNFSQLIAQFNLDSAIRSVVATLNDARVRAITEGQDTVVGFSPDTKKFTVTDADERVVAERELPAGVTLAGSFSNVTFTSLGTLPVQNSSTSFSLHSSTGGRTLMIRRTGKVDVL